jgi:hypothetical protein
MRIGNYFAGTLLALMASTPAIPASALTPFNTVGNLLISDQFNNRVIEVNTKGDIVWSWGLGPTDFSANSIVGVNDAERIGDNTLMAGTGLPPGVGDPFCTKKKGCPDERVMLVDRAGNILWQYGQFGVIGNGPNELNTPVQATWTPRNTVYITDQGNNRVIEVDMKNNILWDYDQLNSPNSAEVLSNGDILIADEGNNRVIEVKRSTMEIVATYTAQGTLSGPGFASKLPNGDILISDSGNNRIITVDRNDMVGFQYFTNKQKGSNPNPQPSHAIMTQDGHIVISDQINNRVIVIDKKMHILHQYGIIDTPGYSTTSTKQGIDWPYDAKVIGDFTGLTQP